MRLRSLTLDRFGHFTDQAFDFGAPGDRPDFHIVYGPNEAGKTTTMTAALRLFYGFPHSDPYAFKHPPSTLQVSGVLEIGGAPQRFTRLKKTRGDLLDAAGSPLPEAALSAHLAGLSEGDYRKLLCLDDDTIEKGGEEIATAQGDIGRLLFSAAAGVADLSGVLDAVQAEAGGLWRKRASKTRVAELKRALAALDRDIRDRDVTASAWRTLRRDLAAAHDEETAARQARDDLRRQAARTAARMRALPVLADLDALEAVLAEAPEVPEQLDFDPETLVALIAEDSGLRADADRLAQEIAETRAALERLPAAPDLPDLAGRLDALESLSKRDGTAVLDLDRRRAELRQIEADMRRAAAELGVSEDTDPRDLVLAQADLRDLEAAREAVRTAEAEAEREALEVTRLAETRAAALATQAELPDTARDMQVAPLLELHDVERLAPAFARAQAEIAQAEREAATRLRGLELGATRLDSLPPCPVSERTAQDWADRQADLTQRIAQAEDSLAQHRETAAARAAQVGELTRDSGLLTDAEVNALRTERDALWDRHKSTMAADTAAAFETAMSALDAAQARRLGDASALGQLRQVGLARAEAEARLTEAKARLDGLLARQAALQAEQAEAAKGLDTDAPQSAAGWLDWVRNHGAATLAQRQLEDLRAAHASVLNRAQALLEALAPLVPQEAPDLETALAIARDLAEAERTARAEVERQAETLARLDRELGGRKARQESARRAARDAEAAWTARVRTLLGEVIDPARLIAALDPLRSLRETEIERARLARSIEGMERDRAQFGEAVHALAAEAGLAASGTAAETYAALRALQAAALATEERRARLSGEADAAESARQTCCARRDQIAREVEAMGRVFPPGTPVDTLDALRRAALTAQKVQDQRNRRDALARQLCSELGVPDVAQARAALAGATPAALEGQAASEEAEMQQAERVLTAATEARVTSARALAQVSGTDEVAALQARRVTLELELEEAALHHLELALGLRQAGAALRRYRDVHRSAMMAATERCFAMLTAGAYGRLVTQPEGDREVLLALDAAGSAKRVAEMSKGTRFQLYLALRAAAHEQLVAQGTVLPFFCDDIFETFDEDRTSAACRVMERIGRSGQAIYLTHHRHVVEIARAVCETPPMVHELPGAA